MLTELDTFVSEDRQQKNVNKYLRRMRTMSSLHNLHDGHRRGKARLQQAGTKVRAVGWARGRINTTRSRDSRWEEEEGEGRVDA